MANSKIYCQICGIELPNKWAVAKREIVDGKERCYCHLHANLGFAKTKAKGDAMTSKVEAENSAQEQEQEIVRSATSERVKKAWMECSAMATKLGGGVKTLWAKIHPDRSPEAMLTVLNTDLEGNHQRLESMRPEIDRVYKEIVAKKREYQTATAVRQRLLKIELQTLMARYKGLEREFSILCENERSIEAVKSRFLEILAYDLRGKLSVSMVDRLADDIDDKAEDAEDMQDALGDLEHVGKRKERGADDFDEELALFDNEFESSETDELSETNQKENKNANNNENTGVSDDDSVVA